MNTQVQTQNETASEIVEAGIYFPAVGKTATEKKVNAIREANNVGVALYGLTSKSKAVRDEASKHMGAESIAAVLRAKMSGNWKPLAGLFALILGETVKFGTNAAGEVLTGDALRARLKRDWYALQIHIEDSLEKTAQYTKSGKLAPKWAKFDEARQVFEAVEKAEAAELERREAARAEREAQAQLTEMRNA